MEIELVKNIPFDASVSAWDYSCGVSWKDYAEMFEAFKNRMQESAYVKTVMMQVLYSAVPLLKQEIIFLKSKHLRTYREKQSRTCW